MIQIDREKLESLLSWDALIDALDDSFRSDIEVPVRQHFDFQHSVSPDPSMLLIMPAWKVGGFLGIKIIIMSSGNHLQNLATIQGTYILFEADTGLIRAELNAPSLTNLRTAACSALASRYLSRTDSQTLLMVGTGSLAPYLVRAHAAVRSLKQVLIWGRSEVKQKAVIKQLREHSIEAIAVKDLEKAVAKADVISCATSSVAPLIKGEWLQVGQHLDLVGSYKPHMREMDDLAMMKAKFYIDTPHCLHETGDVVIPMESGVIDERHIKGDLPGLTNGTVAGRESPSEITCFKSVGHASEDLAAASLAYQRYIENS